jgi:hypothetical protein
MPFGVCNRPSVLGGDRRRVTTEAEVETSAHDTLALLMQRRLPRRQNRCQLVKARPIASRKPPVQRDVRGPLVRLV